MRRLGILFCVMAATTGGAAAQLPPAAEPARMLHFELREGSRVIGTPSLSVQVGRPAALSIGDYSMRFRMDRAAAPAGGPAPFVVRSSLYRAEGNWALVASPAVTVAAGEQARLDFSGSDGRNLSLAVRVQ